MCTEGVIGAPCSVRTIVKRRKGITRHATWYVSHVHVMYILHVHLRESPRKLLREEDLEGNRTSLFSVTFDVPVGARGNVWHVVRLLFKKWNVLSWKTSHIAANYAAADTFLQLHSSFLLLSWLNLHGATTFFSPKNTDWSRQFREETVLENLMWLSSQ